MFTGLFFDKPVIFEEKSMSEKLNVKKYNPLIGATGLGTALGSGIIVALGITITLWQAGMNLSEVQVGIVSGSMTFAIAAGSLLAGTLAKALGMFRIYNYINIMYAIGALLCVVTNNFTMLFVGVVLCGFSSGLDLPITLTILSHDAPDERTSARLIAVVQLFWNGGAFAGTIIGFLVSRMEGLLGARIMFGVLVVVASASFVWRNFSGKVKQLHEEGRKYRLAEGENRLKEISFVKLFRGPERKKYLQFFILITIYYCTWNIISNTFGQFQTYILVKANATQFVATGVGIALSIVGFFAGMIYARVAGSNKRNLFFYIGAIIQIAAMIGIAIGSGSIVVMIVMLALNNLGTPFAGETTYKVWTQESFPMEARASIQGFINGLSRFICGIFALIAPMLVEPERIQNTMYGAAVIIIISAVTGAIMIRMQKKYDVGQM